MTATTLKKIRRLCLNRGVKNRTCRGCVLYSTDGCKIARVPALWDLREIYRLLKRKA